MIEKLDTLIAAFAEFMWGPPLLVLLLGGGLFFTLYCQFIPFRYVRHGLNVLRGKYDDPNDPGQVNHFQALSSALASTVGMGNISGVAIAIHTGGPGALFWMWVSAIVGMATKFFTCTLAIMYRGTDEDGEVQGGPMYVITQGLSKKFHPLAYLFSFAGLLGCLSLFQANQLTQIVQDQIYTPFGYFQNNPMLGQLLIGILMAGVISAVIFGGIRRIGQVASKLVPSMVVIYMLCGVIILIRNFTMIDDIFLSIVRDAFTGEAVLGGSMGAVIVIGIRRAAFSNEAGIGTAPMAHGASKTSEPVREGLVAMLGPAIDTLFVCTLTALAILVTGVWQSSDANGVSLTAMAFNDAIPGIGKYVLLLCIATFSISSLFTYSYYGTKCMSFLFGDHNKHYYNYFYIASILLGATTSLSLMLNLIDGTFALMAIPTMTATLILAPKVVKEAKAYFIRMKNH